MAVVARQADFFLNQLVIASMDRVARNTEPSWRTPQERKLINFQIRWLIFNNTPTGIAPSGSDAGRDNVGSIVLTNQARRAMYKV